MLKNNQTGTWNQLKVQDKVCFKSTLTDLRLKFVKNKIPDPSGKQVELHHQRAAGKFPAGKVSHSYESSEKCTDLWLISIEGQSCVEMKHYGGSEDTLTLTLTGAVNTDFILSFSANSCQVQAFLLLSVWLNDVF